MLHLNPVKRNFDEDFLKSFGRHLRSVRMQQEISLRSLAIDADIEHSLLSRIERGKVNPTVLTIYALAKALDIEISALLNFKVEKQRSTSKK